MVRLNTVNSWISGQQPQLKVTGPGTGKKKKFLIQPLCKLWLLQQKLRILNIHAQRFCLQTRNLKCEKSKEKAQSVKQMKIFWALFQKQNQNVTDRSIPRRLTKNPQSVSQIVAALPCFHSSISQKTKRIWFDKTACAFGAFGFKSSVVCWLSEDLATSVLLWSRLRLSYHLASPQLAKSSPAKSDGEALSIIWIWIWILVLPGVNWALTVSQRILVLSMVKRSHPFARSILFRFLFPLTILYLVAPSLEIILVRKSFRPQQKVQKAVLFLQKLPEYYRCLGLKLHIVHQVQLPFDFSNWVSWACHQRHCSCVRISHTFPKNSNSSSGAKSHFGIDQNCHLSLPYTSQNSLFDEIHL